MPKFIMIYKGEATDMSEMTPEQGAAVMAKWGAWMEQVGSSLVDVGSPFGPGVSVVDDGSKSSPVSLSGYSIVDAANLDGAQALADGHPYLSDGDGKFAIEIFELMPAPFDS
jgi:hypothetical protein